MGKLICHSVVLQMIVSEVDEHGRPIDEHTAPAVKVFRAVVRDVWAEVDKTVAVLEKQRRDAGKVAPPAPPAAVVPIDAPPRRKGRR